MRNLKELSAIVRREQSAETLRDEELFRLASQARLPITTLDIVTWAECEGLPLLQELAQRFGDVANLPEMIAEPDAAA